jgi:hypothetical protein
MDDENLNHPTTIGAFRLQIERNSKLTRENAELREANKSLSKELQQIEQKKKLWLKRAGWVLVVVCAWLLWKGRNIPWDWEDGAPGAGGN